MWVQKCDICGEEKQIDRFRCKVKVAREVFCWEDHWWEKLDICDDCQKKIIKILRQRTNDRISKEPKKGKWVHDEFGTKCPCCGFYAYRIGFMEPWESNFCPNCGADLRKEKAIEV